MGEWKRSEAERVMEDVEDVRLPGVGQTPGVLAGREGEGDLTCERDAWLRVGLEVRERGKGEDHHRRIDC